VEVWDEGLATLEGDAYDGALDVGGGEGRKVVEVGDGDLEVGGVDLCATGELDAEVAIAEAATNSTCGAEAEAWDGGERGGEEGGEGEEG